MDVELPSGLVIEGIPEGTSKEEIKRKAIASGLATEADFGVEPSALQRTGEVPVMPEQMGQLPDVYAPNPTETSLGQMASGALETGASMASGATFGTLGQMAGTAQGVLEYLSQGDFSKPPGELVQQRAMEGAGRMTIKPVTETGQRYAQEAGEALAPLAGIAPNLAIEAGALRSGMQQFNNVAGANIGERMAQRNPKVRSVDGEYIPRQTEGPQPVPKLPPRNAGIREAIRENTVESVGYKIDTKTNKPVANMLERDLVDKYKIEPRTILATREMGGGTKKSAIAMFDIAERYLKGQTETRPNVVIGDVFMKRFNRVLSENRKAAGLIDDIAGKELAGRRVDASNAFNTFQKDLADMGVQFDGKGKPMFTGSELSGNRVVAPINRVYEWIGDRNRVDALMNREPRSIQDGLKLHRMKRFIDRQIEWGNDPAQPLDRRAVMVLKKLRRNINESLKDVSDDYAKQNAIYSETVDEIGKATDVLGRRFDPDSELVSDHVGDQLRKTLSNYGVRNDMRKMIYDIDRTAVKYGGDFDDKIMPLIRVYSDLEGKVGSFAPNSLQGIGEKVMDQGISKLGTMGELGKTGYEAAKRRSMYYETQDAEKLKLIQMLRDQIKEQ